MSDDQGEKTEQPTQRRLEDSRKEGQVARSADLSGSALMLLAFALLHVFGKTMARKLEGATVQWLSRAGEYDTQAQSVQALLGAGLWLAATTLAPLLLALLLGALALNVAQVGWVISTKPLEWKFDRLNPVTGMGKLLSLRSFVRMVFGMAKMALVGALLYLVLQSEIPTFLGLMKNMSTTGNGTARIAAFVAEETVLLGLYASLSLTLVSLAEYFYQRWQHRQDLMMSKQEVKDETRNMEGDPQIKRRRMEAQRRMAKGRMMKDAREADVMVVNPTHFTVALKYERDAQAPRVVAKGADALALKLRQVAAECGIPLVERPQLARSLYRHVEVGEAVPQRFWKAVAEVLAYVWRHDAGKRAEMLEEARA